MSVTIGFIHPGMVHTIFMDCLFGFATHDPKNYGGYIAVECAYIPEARNLVVKKFLADPKKEWLLFVDYDIGFHPTHPAQLLALADTPEKPIVCGMYVNRFGTTGEIRPCWTEMKDGEPHTPVSDFTVGEIRDLTVPALGFCLIHRSVLEKMKEAHAGDAWHWFGHDLIDGQRVGEDMTFADRARALGYKIIGDGGVLLGHRKYSILDITSGGSRV